MTREEFEAVLAVEGKYINVQPIITRAGVWWNASVWEWFDPLAEISHEKAKQFLRAMGLPTEPHERRIGVVRGASTNLKAVKHLMWAWEKGHF